MDTKYFGTDGIRGIANGDKLNPLLVMRIGQAAGQIMRHKSSHNRPTVVIGKDTRLSGYMIESALQAGLSSVGFYCLLVGPLPTPAVAMLTRSLRADMGIMITASHNPYQDNGIKIFNNAGIKLCNDKVLEMEALIDNPDNIKLAAADKIGKAVRVEDAVGRYMEFCKTSVPKQFHLHGMRIVVDCANGAAYKIAPKILWELGAQVIRIGCDPDGMNINRNCGATSPASLNQAVQQHGADIGIALDGDADRLIMCDEHGNVIDGDHVLASMATYMQEQGTLNHSTVVSTVMSNLGMEAYLNSKNIQLIRTKVGDHHVESAMREGDYNLGGEQSGHLIFKDYATTGDGLLAALQVLAALRSWSKPASYLTNFYTPWPSMLENICLTDMSMAEEILASDSFKSTMENVKNDMGDSGRILIRKSGTEPVIRVLVEAQETEMVERHTQSLVSDIQSRL